MKIVDLSHTMSIHTPGWVGYAGNKMYYAQNLQTVGIVAQRVETSMHSGTHFDGAMHATDGRTGDMASLPLDYLVSHGVVVDLAPQVSDWSAITPAMIEKSGAEIRDGDILILHTGWHKYYEGQSQQDLVRYFCYHPGPTFETLGMDAQAQDQMVRHGYRLMRPSDEHVDPPYAAGHRPRVRKGDRQGAGGLFRHLRIRAQALGAQSPPRRVSVPQLRVPGRLVARRKSRRRY